MNCLVYVLAKDGKPLMPTKRGGKVRILLKEKKARVVRREPFTIQLLYETSKFMQPLTLGVDPGFKTIGLSVSSQKQEVFASETEIRTDIKEKLSERREFRRNRRSRKLRYREARFNNRKSSKKKGWLPPTIEQKIQSHLNEIDFIQKILPISKIVIEATAFDIQKIINPEIEGTGYQEGALKGFNGHLREYILYRDHHECQNCHGRSKDPVLETHHLLERPKGTDRPDNQTTLCRTCHQKYHRGEIKLNIKPPKFCISETQMNIMRYRLVSEIRDSFEGEVEITYGADTKSRRIEKSLPKSHAIDALMISGNVNARPVDKVYRRTKNRSHNRQIHRATFIKGHVRRRAQTDYEIFGFRLNDKVLFEGKEVFVRARRKSGYFKVANADRSFIKDGVSYKKLKLLEKAKNTTTITEIRQIN